MQPDAAASAPTRLPRQGRSTNGVAATQPVGLSRLQRQIAQYKP